MARVESIDLGSCRVSYVDDQPAGVALIGRRGWTSRLAAMCIVPASRGRGVGRASMDMLLAEASARGDRGMLLEVIESNASAVRLYGGCGFRIDRRLVGYEGAFTENSAKAGLQEVDIRAVAHLVTTCGLDSLPWQISGESLAQASPPGKAYQLDDAYAVISNPEAVQVSIRSVIVRPEARRQGQATRLLNAIIAKYPNKKWLVPALCPEEIGGLFVKAGFSLDKLSQLQMSLEIK
jgi:ribosomal protein S18 acetylase RimI-like enzyme